MATANKPETKMVQVPLEIVETAAGVVSMIGEVRNDMDAIEEKLQIMEKALEPIQPFLDQYSADQKSLF